MRTNLKKVIAVMLFLAAFTTKTTAQNPQLSVMANYIYSQDSIAGFDEQAASAGALTDGFFGKEFKIYMYRAKRDYVKQRYHLKTAPPVTLYQNPISSRPPAVPGGACNNEDFELATSTIVAPNAVQGWSLQSGSNNNSCQQPVLNANNLYTVYTAPVVDARIPGAISSYFDASSNTTPSGNAFIRLNNDQAGAKAVRLSKSFIPTPTSALFQYAYVAVIEDGSHPCCDQAGFNIKVTITNTVTNTPTLLACPNISVAVPGAACTFTIPAGGPSFSPCVGAPGWSYANWTASALDLTQYINNLVTIDVTVVDCNAGGHGAYFYFDAKCSPMSVTGNGNSFPAGSANVTVPTCGASGATICATPGLGPYSWAGPGVTGPYGTPSMTNQCFTSSLSATYTLYMQPPGSCAPIARVITTTITPAPLLLASVAQATCGGTTAVVTLTPSGSAANPSSLVWSPTPASLNTQTTIGTYNIPPGPTPLLVTIVGLDPLGCSVTQTVNVNPAPPTPTFNILNVTASPSITCATPSVDLSAVSNYTYGTLTYFWASNSATYTTSQVNLTSAGTITCLITDPATNCQNSNTITIGINTVAPLSVVSPSNQNLTCNTAVTTVTATANPSVNISHYILSPYGGSVTATSHTMVYSPACGTYTHLLVNDINGCVTSKTFSVNCNNGFPTFSVVSAQNFTIGCNSTSCAVVNITNGNTSNPPGGPVSYTILPPGGSSVTPTGSLSGVSNYTLCAPGSYTVVVKDNTSFCETRVPISILQNTFAPNISAVMDRTRLDCYNPKVTLKGVSTNTNVTYSWLFQGTPNTQPGDTITVNADFATTTKTIVNTFSLVITDNSSTCKSMSVIPIQQNLFLPKTVISNGGINSISCTTPSVMLTNLSTTGIPPATGYPTNSNVVGFLWEGPTPQEPLSNSSTYLGLTTGIYKMTAKDLNNGCTSFTTLTIDDNRVYPVLNNPTSPGTYSVDCGDDKGIDITVNVTGVTANLLSYNWIPVAGTSVSPGNSKFYKVLLVGEYPVIVTNISSGCASKTIVPVYEGRLTADFEPDVVSGFAPLTVKFTNKSASSNTVTGTQGIVSQWSFANGTSKTYSSTETASTIYTQPGTYTVSLFASKGKCKEVARRVIKVEIPSALEIPNVFTPNNDGVNDFFFLKAANLSAISARIFDRWGHLIYEINSETGNISWDGKNQLGKEVAAGTYFYIIKALGNDQQEYNYKGTVSLYR